MTQRLSVDAATCQGYANCLIEAPSLFDFDEDASVAIVLVEEPGAQLQAQAEAAVRGCPARAVLLQDPE